MTLTVLRVFFVLACCCTMTSLAMTSDTFLKMVSSSGAQVCSNDSNISPYHVFPLFAGGEMRCAIKCFVSSLCAYFQLKTSTEPDQCELYSKLPVTFTTSSDCVGFAKSLLGQMDLVRVPVSNTLTISCKAGFNLLSCGLNNSQYNNGDPYRWSIPIDSTSCKCNEWRGVFCMAWCTSKTVLGFEGQWSANIAGVSRVTCSAGKKVLGCGINPIYPAPVSPEQFREYYPYSDITGCGCTCYDGQGAQCVASCASNILNHEIVTNNGTGNVVAQCPTGKYVLGCGVGQPSTSNWERFQSYHVTSATSADSCTCYNRYWVTCYATCGQFN